MTLFVRWVLFWFLWLVVGIVSHSATSEVSVDLKNDVKIGVKTIERLKEDYRAMLTNAGTDTCVEAKASTSNETLMGISLEFKHCERISAVRLHVESVDDSRSEKTRVKLRPQDACGNATKGSECRRDATVSGGFLHYTCDGDGHLHRKRVTVGIPDGVKFCGLTVYKLDDVTKIRSEPSAPSITPTSLLPVGIFRQDEKCLSILVAVGQSLTLRCHSAEGYPLPEYRWQLKDGDISGSGRRVARNNVLQFDPLIVDDSGQYRCRASNSKGSRETCVNINLYESISQVCRLAVVEGTATFLNLEVVCPTPVESRRSGCEFLHYNVSYGRDGSRKPVKMRRVKWSPFRLNHLAADTSYNVTLFAVYKEDYCNEINTVISSHLFTTPHPPPTDVRVSVTATSADVTWDVADSLRIRNVMYRVEYFDGDNKRVGSNTARERRVILTGLEPYTRYRVEVSASVGNLTTDRGVCSFRTDEAAPSSPQNVEVLNVRSRLVTVSWSPPRDKNGRVVKYRVFVLPASSSVSQLNVSRGYRTVSSSKTTATVTQLTPDTRYKVWVAAINGEVDELISYLERALHFTTKPEVLPPPRNVSSVNLTSSSVVITWSKPPTPRGVWSGYKISFYKSDHKVFSFKTDECSWYVQDLHPYTRYEVYVQTSTLINSSLLWSDPAVVDITTKQAAPSRPTDLKKLSATRSFQLRWKPPRRPNGNIPLYVISIRKRLNESTGTSVVREAEAKDGSLSINVTKLSPFTAYRASIAAVNMEDGKRLVGQSLNIEVSTLDESPTAPSSCSIIERHYTMLHVSWKRPHPGDYKVVFYNLTYVELPNRKRISKLVYGTNDRIRELVPHKQYDITITAVTNNTGVHVGPPCFLTAKTGRPQLVNESRTAGNVPIHSLEFVVVETSRTSSWFQNMTFPSRKDDRVVDIYVAEKMESEYEGDRFAIRTGDGRDEVLKSGTTYAVYARFVSLEDDGVTLTSVSLPLVLTTKSPDGGMNSAVIGGLAAGTTVGVFLLVGIIVYYVFRRNARPKAGDRSQQTETRTTSSAHGMYTFATSYNSNQEEMPPYATVTDVRTQTLSPNRATTSNPGYSTAHI